MLKDEFRHIPLVATMTAATHNAALHVPDIFYVAELPEYPPSSATGIAYIVDVTFMDEEHRGIVEDGVCVVDRLIIRY